MSQYSQQYSSTESEKNSKLVKGIVLGGIIGGVVSLMDSNTRNSVKQAAVGLKSSSQKVLTEVKENPGDLKEQMITQFREASNILKDAIGDAQSLYEKVNNDLFSKMGDVKDLTNTAMSTVKDAKGDIVQIGSKFAEAGTELKAVASQTTLDTSATSTNTTSTYDTAGSSNSTLGTSTTGGTGSSVSSYSNTGSNQSDAKNYSANNTNQKSNHTLGGQETPDHDKKKK